MPPERSSVYRPLVAHLSMLFEFFGQIVLSAAAIAYLTGSLLYGSGLAGAVAFVVVVLAWIAGCLRTRLTITDASLTVVNRWRTRVIPRESVQGFEARGASRGLFDLGGRTFPVATIILKGGAGAINIDVSVSVRQKERQLLVDLLKSHRYPMKGLAHYVVDRQS